jgi:hypothetical protein
MLYTSYMTSTPANPSADYVRETVQVALDNMRQGKLAGVISYELMKDFVTEPEDKKAFSGNGYLSLFVPAGVRTKPGDNVSATQIIHPDGSGSYSLSFRTMDEGPNLAGYHFKQVLIDDRVVWEQDVAKNTANGQWEEVVLDLTPYLAGKTSANLTIRFYEKNGVSNFFDNVGFDLLQAKGFSIANGDFEEKSGWSITSTYPGMIGEILIYDPDRQKKVFEAVQASYISYALYAGIVQSDMNPGVRNSLSVKAEKMMDFYFAEQIDKALNELKALANEIHAQGGKHVPQETADLWNAKIVQLEELYQGFQ